jgi:hypothetical protein
MCISKFACFCGCDLTDISLSGVGTKIHCFLIVLYIIITKLYLNKIIFGGKNGGYDYEGYGY